MEYFTQSKPTFGETPWTYIHCALMMSHSLLFLTILLPQEKILVEESRVRIVKLRRVLRHLPSRTRPYPLWIVSSTPGRFPQTLRTQKGEWEVTPARLSGLLHPEPSFCVSGSEDMGHSLVGHSSTVWQEPCRGCVVQSPTAPTDGLCLALLTHGIPCGK